MSKGLENPGVSELNELEDGLYWVKGFRGVVSCVEKYGEQWGFTGGRQEHTTGMTGFTGFIKAVYPEDL
ncbi:hypothetical protein HN803_05045 [candidate division WWE3 bacterium]|mgnify:CR=1 FL=1|jgi:hypothetical protein|nr:hypothetical protein [candidate division WWE3 bacterium]